MPRLIRTTAHLAAALFVIGCPSTPDKPDEKPVRAMAARPASRKKAPDVSKEARQAFENAVKAYHDQKKTGRFDYDDLLARFEAALQQDPKMAEAHYNLGCIYEAMREDAKAAEHYKKAMKLRPDLTLAAANMGALLARSGKLSEALAIYERALDKDAKNSPVLLNMAAIHQQQKKYDLALKRAGEVLVRDPTNIGAYRVMASVYYAMGKMDMSRLICLRGLTVKKNDPSLLNTLGLVLLKLKKIPEALAQFRAALQQRPDMVPTRFNIAKVALDYKDFRVAREEFTKILQYEPSNKQAAMGLGIAMRGVGDFDAAKKQFLALAGKHARDPVPRQWLCRLALRNFNDAKEAKKECGLCVKLQNKKPAKDHPCVAMYDEARQGIEMDKKMKVLEAKAAEEQRRFEEKMARLAKLRKETVEKAWERAKKECDVLPPAKLEGDKLEFVLDPLAITAEEKTKVLLVGAIFKGVKRINIGTNKVKWKQINEHTLEMVVPEGLPEGPWDVLLTFKDKSEMYFGGGLWVGKKPKCEEKPKQPEKAPEKPKDTAGKAKKTGPSEGQPPGKESEKKEKPPAGDKKDEASKGAAPAGEPGGLK